MTDETLVSGLPMVGTGFVASGLTTEAKMTEAILIGLLAIMVWLVMGRVGD